MAGKKISVSTANAMVTKYIEYVSPLGVDPKKKTQWVGFTLTDLQKWLEEVKPNTDELRIFMGIYPDGSSDAGRVSVVLWPYKDGRPANKPLTAGKGGDDEPEDPFNDGSNGP